MTKNSQIEVENKLISIVKQEEQLYLLDRYGKRRRRI